MGQESSWSFLGVLPFPNLLRELRVQPTFDPVDKKPSVCIIELYGIWVVGRDQVIDAVPYRVSWLILTVYRRSLTGNQIFELVGVFATASAQNLIYQDELSLRTPLFELVRQLVGRKFVKVVPVDAAYDFPRQ